MSRRGSKKIVPYKDQSYECLYKDYLENEAEFDDDQFSPISWTTDARLLDFKRAKDLCKTPILLGSITHRDGIIQGKYACPWFATVCNLLSRHPVLVNQIIPDAAGQSWDWFGEEFHPGIFQFVFWRLGKLYSVVVDDKIPVQNNNTVFTHVNDGRQFWCALLEKAYAKFCGSYSILFKVPLQDMLTEITGGVCFRITLAEKGFQNTADGRQNFYHYMLSLQRENAIIVCDIQKTNVEDSQRTPLGICKGSYYPVMKLSKIYPNKNIISSITRTKNKVYLIRLKQPQHDQGSSDGENYMYTVTQLIRRHTKSREWSAVVPEDHRLLGLQPETEGEFWMPLDDFLDSFSEITVCYLKRERHRLLSGKWSLGPRGSPSDRSGGCHEFRQSFLRNPQYTVKGKPQEEILIQLSQEGKVEDLQNICVYAMQVEMNRKYRVHRLTGDVLSGSAGTFRYSVLRLSLMAAMRYVIIPTTRRPGIRGEFNLRILSNSNVTFRELVKDYPGRPLLCCLSGPKVATSLHLLAVECFQEIQPKQGCFSLCPGKGVVVIFRCGGKKVKTCAFLLDAIQFANIKVVFYRKTSRQPIKIEIWRQGITCDSFVGRGEIAPFERERNPQEVEVELFGRYGKKHLKMGSVLVSAFTTGTLGNV